MSAALTGAHEALALPLGQRTAELVLIELAFGSSYLNIARVAAKGSPQDLIEHLLACGFTNTARRYADAGAQMRTVK